MWVIRYQRGSGLDGPVAGRLPRAAGHRAVHPHVGARGQGALQRGRRLRARPEADAAAGGLERRGRDHGLEQAGGTVDVAHAVQRLDAPAVDRGDPPPRRPRRRAAGAPDRPAAAADLGHGRDLGPGGQAAERTGGRGGPGPQLDPVAAGGERACAKRGRGRDRHGRGEHDQQRQSRGGEREQPAAPCGAVRGIDGARNGEDQGTSRAMAQASTTDAGPAMAPWGHSHALQW